MSYPNYPQQQPQYPPQQQYQQPYYPPQAPPQPQQPLARGTIDDFYGQPAASGKSISFNGKPPGTTYTGVVARTLTHADVQQQTNIQRQPLWHPDGRPKFVMIIPLQMQPSAEFPDGRAAWYVKGNDKTELERAMEAAGCPPGTPPEMGAIISITYTGDRPIPNLNAQKMKTVHYTRPSGAAAASADEPANRLQPNGQAAAATTGQPASALQPPFQPPYQEAAAGPQQPAAQPVPAPADLTPDQQALIARLIPGNQ